MYETVSRVPPGSVTTYGDVAGALGARSVARHVGFALAALPAERADVPWHRVVSGRGQVSRRSHGAPSDEQILRLAAEGVEVDVNGRVTEFASRRWAGARRENGPGGGSR